ncbi:MAG TPA: citrate lyase holo-[acyl-carrier protein] synthase [Myxococcales bacterium]|nr:citrate lyase holo-[acyl-carrier protein] synthase [Myxococcales bacterium]
MPLHSVLDARERRYLARRERELGRPGVLVEVTLNVPGWPKGGPPFTTVFRAGMRAVAAALGRGPLDARLDAAGYYGLFRSRLPARDVKRAMCRVEEQAPWARLLDIDCHGEGGKLSRESVGVAARRCFLCAAPHEDCIRARRHPPEALRAAAEQLARTCLEGAPC